MPVDFYLNSRFDTEWNDVGDVRKARDSEYVQQCVITDIVENVGLKIGSLTATNVEEHRGDIETVVENNHATSQPVTVTVEDINEESNTVTYRISTNKATFAITTE